MIRTLKMWLIEICVIFKTGSSASLTGPQLGFLFEEHYV